ncbi:hypothetical protein JCM21900_003541 [Sporobolomyces salmonicolor]
MLRSSRSARPPRSARHLLARAKSSVAVVQPASPDGRSLALPLAFLSVRGWDQPGLSGWDVWSRAFARKGYTSLLLEVDPSSAAVKATSSQALLASLEQDLVALLRNPSTASPFPPLLFTSSASSLLAETYVSSHPLSGLCLHSPLAAPHAHKRLPAVFPTPLGEFNYEPLFPIAVVQPPGGEQPCRLLEEFGEEGEDALVQRIVAGRDEEGWQKVMDWMDENGL